MSPEVTGNHYPGRFQIKFFIRDPIVFISQKAGRSLIDKGLYSFSVKLNTTERSLSSKRALQDWAENFVSRYRGIFTLDDNADGEFPYDLSVVPAIRTSKRRIYGIIEQEPQGLMWKPTLINLRERHKYDLSGLEVKNRT